MQCERIIISGSISRAVKEIIIIFAEINGEIALTSSCTQLKGSSLSRSGLKADLSHCDLIFG